MTNLELAKDVYLNWWRLTRSPTGNISERDKERLISAIKDALDLLQPEQSQALNDGEGEK